MNSHHIICEKDKAQACPYCGTKVNGDEWKSQFDSTNFHYKEKLCSCGKQLSVKVDFMGSGDDNWSDDLDKRIRDAQED